MPARAAYLISDAHLGAEPKDIEAPREARLIAFLHSLPGRARSLYVVGDLFEFWFEYRTAVPRRYFELLATLRDVRRAGVEITCLAGNHDFWLGPFLRDEVGLRVHDGALSVNEQGRRIWLHHGDGLLGGDLGYSVLKRVVRHPLSLRLYRWIHPDVGIPLAHWASHWSRNSRGQAPLDGDRLVEGIARPRFEEGYDAVMIGHFHQVLEHREGRRAFFVLGDWMRQFTYVALEEGEFRLEVWPDAEPARLRTAP
jgi:UDP-2,3-diacylglucosamine hydrolase